jgi:hypothetical protein
MLPLLPEPPVPAASMDSHSGGGLPEALSFLDLASTADTHPGGTLPEALSFLDLASTLELFEPTGEEPGPPAPAPPAPGEPKPTDSQGRGMAPLVVKLLPPQPAKSGAGNGGPSRAPLPPSPLRGLRPAHAWSASATRHAPVLQVNLPPEADGGELEVQVQVRRNGLLVAESATSIAGGPDGAGTLTLEFKRS